MTENSTGHGLRSRARRQSTLTREAIEEVLYDKAYSWELVPGSDVMATCVGVLPKVGGYIGYDYYAGLVTVVAGSAVYIEAPSNWFLVDAAAPMSTDGIQNADVPPMGPLVATGVYLAVYEVAAGSPPPYAFPEGWTPGNTTGSGPVLPYIGNSDGGPGYWAGLVELAEDGVAPPSGTSSFFGLPPSTPLTVEALDVTAGYITPGDPMPKGVYLGVWSVNADEPQVPPTALPEGWTFRPYGLGPVAITDENAGGLIGDVAYVVSGYMYNGSLWAFDPPSKGLLASGSTTAVEVGDTFTTLDASRAGNLAYQISWIVTGAGNVVVLPDGFLDGSSTATADQRSDALTYWPFIERFDLANKKWLPRVPLPQLSIPAPIFGGPWDVAVNYSSGSTLQHNSHMWTANADTAVGDEPGVSPKWDMTDPPAALKPFASEGGIGGVIDGKLYFGGGDGDDITGQEFFCYDPADDSITRLADMDVVEYPDYNPYGVLGGRLWYFAGGGGSEHPDQYRAHNYDPQTGVWSHFYYDGTDLVSGAGDQIQGFEIDGKLWFVYDGAAFVFDPVALTVTAKAGRTESSVTRGGPEFLIDGKIHELAIPESRGPAIYDPLADIWTVRTDVANEAPTQYDGESVWLTHEGTPYVLSALFPDRRTAVPGIYGLTSVVIDKPESRRLSRAHLEEVGSRKVMVSQGLVPVAFPVIGGKAAGSLRIDRDLVHDSIPSFAFSAVGIVSFGRFTLVYRDDRDGLFTTVIENGVGPFLVPEDGGPIWNIHSTGYVDPDHLLYVAGGTTLFFSHVGTMYFEFSEPVYR